MTPLPLTCDDCSACCTHEGRLPAGCYVIHGHDEPATLPAALRVELEREARNFGPDVGRPCIWLDVEARRCKHYEHRPRVCRSVEIGGRICQQARKRDGV